jgi:hypothetical protein
MGAAVRLAMPTAFLLIDGERIVPGLAAAACFPASPEVNPCITIMALADRVPRACGSGCRR